MARLKGPLGSFLTALLIVAMSVPLAVTSASASGNANFVGTWILSNGGSFIIIAQSAGGACTQLPRGGFSTANCRVSGDDYSLTAVETNSTYESYNKGVIKGNTLTGSFTDTNGTHQAYTGTRASPLGLTVALTAVKGTVKNTLSVTMTLTNTGSSDISGLTFTDPSGLENDGVLIKKSFIGPTKSGLTLTSGPTPALPTTMLANSPPVVVNYTYSTDMSGDAVLVADATATDAAGDTLTVKKAATIFVTDPPATEADYQKLVTSVLLDADTISNQGQNTLATDEANSLAAGLNLSAASPGQQAAAVQLGLPTQLGVLIGTVSNSALGTWTGAYFSTLATDVKGGLSDLGQTGTALASQMFATAVDPQARAAALGRFVDGVEALPSNVQAALASQSDNLGYLGAALAATNSKTAAANLASVGSSLLDTLQSNTSLAVSGFPAMVAADNAAYAKDPTGFMKAEAKQYADDTYGLVKTEIATVFGDGIFKGIGAAVKAGFSAIPSTAAEASSVDAAVAKSVDSTAPAAPTSNAALMQNANAATSQFQTLEAGTPLVSGQELAIGGMTPGDQVGFQKALNYIKSKFGVELEVGVRTSEPLSVGIDGSPKLSFMKPKAVSAMDMEMGAPSQIQAYTGTQTFDGGVTTVFKPVPIDAAKLAEIGETNPAFVEQYNARFASQTKLWNEYQDENSTLRVLVKASDNSSEVTAISNVPGYPVPPPPAGGQPLVYLQQLDDPAFVQQFGLTSEQAQTLKTSLVKSPGAIDVDYIARPNPDGSVSFFDGLNNNRPFVSDMDLQYYRPAGGAPWPPHVSPSTVQQQFLDELSKNIGKLPDHGPSGTVFDLTAAQIGVADGFVMSAANPAFAQAVADRLAARYASQSAIFSSNAARLTALAGVTSDPAEVKALLAQAQSYRKTAAAFSKVDAAYLLAKYPPGEKIIVIKIGDVRVGYGV
jgi:hypothetical protein